MDKAYRIVRVEDVKEADVGQVVQLFDAAVAWLVPQGRTAQWGSHPRSESESFMNSAKEKYETCTVFHAVYDEGGQEKIIGSMLLSPDRPHPDTVPAPSALELYVHALITDRAPRWRGLGGKLIEHAKQECAAQGVRLLRLDCFGGDDGKLVKAYESMGFVRAPHEPMLCTRPTGEIWPMQVMEMWL